METEGSCSRWRPIIRNAVFWALSGCWAACGAFAPGAAVRGLENVKVLRVESRYFLEWMVRPGCVSRLHYLCPDPWPKERHHKNRLVQDDFLPVLHRSLADGGEFLFKTDHEEYFLWVLDHVARSGLFSRSGWEDDEFFYPWTDFQLQWESMGKPIYRARFIKLQKA